MLRNCQNWAKIWLNSSSLRPGVSEAPVPHQLKTTALQSLTSLHTNKLGVKKKKKNLDTNSSFPINQQNLNTHTSTFTCLNIYSSGNNINILPLCPQFVHITNRKRDQWVPFLPSGVCSHFLSAQSLSGSWYKVLRCDSVPPGGFQQFNRPSGLRVKWNTPSAVHHRHSESPPGCWRGNLGCLLVWRPSLPGFDMSLSAGSGILLLSPGRPGPQRSPLQWDLQIRGQWGHISDTVWSLRDR